MEMLPGFLSADSSTGVVNDLKKIVLPTGGSKNADHDKLKWISLCYFPENASWSVLVFLSGAVCFPLVKHNFHSFVLLWNVSSEFLK
jgi:hypothetical protein